jgi:hypothetical protein
MVDNTSAVVTGNRLGWAPGDEAFRIQDDFSSVTVTGNTIYGSGSIGVHLQDQTRSFSATNINGNHYYGVGFNYGNATHSWSQWRADHGGWDTTSTYSTGAPPDSVQIRPNAYEAGRALVVVRNFSGQGAVGIDPSSFLAPGARYEVVNAFDYHHAPVASGTWNGGAISLPMSGITRATPIGRGAEQNTAPTFGTFIIRTVW